MCILPHGNRKLNPMQNKRGILRSRALQPLWKNDWKMFKVSALLPKVSSRFLAEERVSSFVQRNASLKMSF